MPKSIPGFALFLTLLWVNTSGASLIVTPSDPSLTDAIVDNFSSYAIGDPLSVSDGFYTMTVRNFDDFDPDLRLSVRDNFNGQYGIVGRSIVDYNGTGITITFDSAVSAFGIHVGAGDVGEGWTLEAFSPSGTSLGSGSITVTAANNSNGFFMGWADTSIGSAVFTPSASDVVILDNLSYVVPEPATTALIIGLAAGAVIFFRQSRRG